MHKPDKRKIAEMGGLVVIFGFLIGTFFYVAVDIFIIQHYSGIHYLGRDLQIMAVLATILIVGIIGMVDDILGWKIGLRQWQKPFIVLFAALPMAVVNSGQSSLSLPLIGWIDIGIIYPLALIPIAISCAANGFNMIAGYNGLEAGMGAIMLSALSYLSWRHDQPHIAVLALCMVFALFAFYCFNKNPARVFPGNTLTYAVGTMIAVVAITGNIERAALFVFIPYFIELVLKGRGKMQKESFARVNNDRSLRMPYKKIYGIEHAVIRVLKKFKKKVYERNVVHSLFVFEIIICLIAIGIWG